MLKALSLLQIGLCISGYLYPIETALGKQQPARGVVITASGEVILTAYPTNNAGDRLSRHSYHC